MGHPSPPPGKPRIPAPKVYGAKPRSPQGASGALSPVLTGLIVATLYAVLWTLLVYVVHNPVSLAGWGAGGLIGIALAPAERERLVRTYSDQILGREGFLAMLGKLFSFWDLLWLGLGVSSAWKLAQSVTR